MQAAHEAKKAENSINEVTRGNFPVQKDGTVGVLLLHGFTSAIDAVSGLAPTLEKLRVPYEMPVLRGHNSQPEDLRGVTAEDWYDDGFAALAKLCERADKVIIVGLSMGGLVALNLCARKHVYSEKISGCVTWAAALGFCNPLSWLAKPLSLFVPMWKGQDSFNDAECRKNNRNYRKFPTKAFVELYDFAYRTRKLLVDVKVPICIIQSRLDQVVPYRMSGLIFEKAGTDYCEYHSLTRSGHELGQDCEADYVFELTETFIRKFM